MCGICGELRFYGAAPDLGALGRMSETLASRGLISDTVIDGTGGADHV